MTLTTAAFQHCRSRSRIAFKERPQRVILTKAQSQFEVIVLPIFFPKLRRVTLVRSLVIHLQHRYLSLNSNDDIQTIASKIQPEAHPDLGLRRLRAESF